MWRLKYGQPISSAQTAVNINSTDIVKGALEAQCSMLKKCLAGVFLCASIDPRRPAETSKRTEAVVVDEGHNGQRWGGGRAVEAIKGVIRQLQLPLNLNPLSRSDSLSRVNMGLPQCSRTPCTTDAYPEETFATVPVLNGQ